MSVRVKAIFSSINEMIVACETIRSAERCSECPYKDSCFIDESFEHIAYTVSLETIEKFIFFADEVAEDEEEKNKTDEERKWEAEAEKWNLRRCDPDE